MLLKKTSIVLLLVILAGGKVYAQQPCTGLGQNPSTAFPVCGTSVFYQDSVPLCSSNFLYVPGCSVYGDSSTMYTNRNPYWYKFTCFQSGTLSFEIIPNALDEDYDWQLYDITGHNPDDVYTDTSLIISGNWSGTYAPTGANDTGVTYMQCGSSPDSLYPTFAMSPVLIAGHNYLLLVSHFTDTEQGYFLSFGGGTAVITDPVPPHLINANRASCDGTKIMVKLNKKMRCASLAADGSDFMISPPAATITSATGIGCTSGFDMDSVLITFNQPLPFNNYQLIVKNGSDANTLFDLCYNEIPVGEAIPFTILSPLPVPMDSIRNNRCFTDSLELVFRFPVQCASVAPDGSDFFVTGTYPVSVTSAVPVNCAGGLTKGITVHLSSTLSNPGNFQLILKVGTDGNTLLSECDTPSVAGSALPFRILPKPVPDFSFSPSVCLPDGKIIFADRSTISDGTQNFFSYAWNFDDPGSGSNNISFLKNPVHRYTATGPYHVRLRVTSNGGCTTDSIKLVNTIHPQPKTGFVFSKPSICAGDPVSITDSTDAKDGVTVQWNWNLGDGSPLQHTQHINNYTYPNEQTYQVSLYSVNSHGCYSDTLVKSITVYAYPTVDAGPDRTVLEGTYLTLHATATGHGLQYLWTPATYLSTTTIADPRCMAPLFSTNYTVKVTADGGCSVSDQVFVKVLKMPLIPNTFTPNNDGVNDFWDIKYLEDYPENHLQVFTRTGQLVFESKGIYQSWNGTYKGRKLPADTYYYILEPGSGRDPLTGYITIIK